jgi:hypothetical protein
MEVFQVPFFSDVDIVLTALGPNKRASSLELFRGFASGKWRFFTMPPAHFVSDSLEGLSDEQVLALRAATRLDASPYRYVILGYGTQSVVKPSLIPILHDMVARQAELTE